jgi:hypothetical protein
LFPATLRHTVSLSDTALWSTVPYVYGDWALQNPPRGAV